MKSMLVGIAAAALAALVVALPASSAVGLTPAETSDLQYMREEEKLARDVYTVLAEEWTEATVFARIAQSEQRHMDAVKVVLDRYGIEDPAAGTKAGEFTNAGLQTLYDQLVAEGSKSVTAALAVGVKIEQVDIADLEDALAATSNEDLERLYGNLLRASKNHLQAFQATADGTVPARAGQGRGPRFGQGAGQGAGLGMGPGAGQGQGDQLRDGTCTGDGQRAGRGPGWRAGGGW
jgi:hypothetical protein